MRAEQKQCELCISFAAQLVEARNTLTLATQRAEAAEAMNVRYEEIYNNSSAGWIELRKTFGIKGDEAVVPTLIAKFKQQGAERDALRKVAERLVKMTEDGTVTTNEDGEVAFVFYLASSVEKLAGATETERAALNGERTLGESSLMFGHVTAPDRITALLDAALALQPPRCIVCGELTAAVGSRYCEDHRIVSGPHAAVQPTTEGL